MRHSNVGRPTIKKPLKVTLASATIVLLDYYFVANGGHIPYPVIIALISTHVFYLAVVSLKNTLKAKIRVDKSITFISAMTTPNRESFPIMPSSSFTVYPATVSLANKQSSQQLVNYLAVAEFTMRFYSDMFSMSNFLDDHQAGLSRAISIALENIKADGGPFGACVVMKDGRVFDGVNRVTAMNDPTAHAEVMAIRNACRELGTFSLVGAVLFSSCEPCPMCLGAALWARVDGVVFAADRFDAADAGFDDAEFYRLVFVGEKVSRVAHLERLAPFVVWRALSEKIEY